MRFAPGNNRGAAERGRRFVLETGPGHYVSSTKARDEQYVHRNNLSPRTPCHVYLILRRFAQRVRKGRGGVRRTPSGFAKRVTSDRPRRLLRITRPLREAGRVTKR